MTHPIETVMRTTMENLKEMIDVDTVVGTPIHMPDGSLVLPVSRVSFGFVSGGGEYGVKNMQFPLEGTPPLPFAGGTGAGVSVSPEAFLLVSGGNVRLLPARSNTAEERLIELIPQLIRDMKSLLGKKTEKPEKPVCQEA